MSEQSHPYLIQSYHGYLGNNRVLLKGRVLENEKFLDEPSDSKWDNFLESFRRFESDEVAEAQVLISLGDRQWELETDKEGYFILDEEIDLDYINLTEPFQAHIDLQRPRYEVPLSVSANLFSPEPTASFGVISDIDDTVLQTHMNSRMRLKMMYVSFLKGAHQRLPMEGMVDLYQQLSNADEKKNPFFYVSNSPWNVHDVLSEFLSLQKLPAGPVLLRDFGWHLVFKGKNPKIHKIESIRHILETYPNLPFVLFGDTASSDADHYAHFREKYPEQIRAVYIRHTQDTRNARRVKALIESLADPNFILIHQAADIRSHAESIGLL